MNKGSALKPGQFICIVGASGSGKDTLIDGVRLQLPADLFIFAQRTITRAPGQPGEIYHSVSESAFMKLQSQNEFLITWKAHGLYYGLPRDILDAQQQGQHIIANGSRTITDTLQTRVSNLTVIEITAPLDILAQRILKRGRETGAIIENRLKRTVPRLPSSIPQMTIHNDQTKDIGIKRLLSAIQHLCQLDPFVLTPKDPKA